MTAMGLDQLIAAIAGRGHIALSQAERQALEAAPATNAMAARILCADAFNRGDYARAIAQARRAHTIKPDRESEESLISCLSRGGMLAEAIARATRAERLPMTRRYTLLSELHAKNGDLTAAGEWGRKALSVKDAATPRPANRFAPHLHEFGPEQPERNIISFSLWGTGERYLRGALRNAVVTRHLYPGWTARFYIDESVPREIRQELDSHGAQLRQVGNLPAAKYGLFWRFLVEDDPDVSLYLVRDAHAVLNIRERVAVQDWLESEQPFHVMRDFPGQCELVLAGMWGAHRGNIGQMGKRILGFVKGQEGAAQTRAADQQFLGQDVWPLMRGRMCCHDSAFGFNQTHSFDPRFALPGKMHVGQDDSVNDKPGNPGAAQG